MKIAVYAISKNEEKFVKRFMENASEADGVYVLDTGSTDQTVQLLNECGAVVSTTFYKNFRFDVARNESLQKVPLDFDFCLCLDLDEVIEVGWRKKLEKTLNSKVKQVRYKYVWSHLDNGCEGYVYWGDKIHARKGFVWLNPVHEVLSYISNDYISIYSDIQIDHYPDETKSRSSYLPLLELSIKEQPENDRNMHYLGREYMFVGENEKCIETLKRHLKLKSATWKDERSASMRFIGVCYERLHKFSMAEKWYLKSAMEAPYLREPFIYLAKFYYKRNNYIGVLFAISRALKIKSRSLSYINEPESFTELPYDLASIACYNLGLFSEALENVEEAIKILPSDLRLQDNKLAILDKINLSK